LRQPYFFRVKVLFVYGFLFGRIWIYGGIRTRHPVKRKAPMYLEP